MKDQVTQSKLLKGLMVAGAVAAGVLGGVEVASAATVLTADMGTALGAGFTDLKDTAADVIGKSWPYMLGILALYAAPKIVKRMWNSVVGG